MGAKPCNSPSSSTHAESRRDARRRAGRGYQASCSAHTSLSVTVVDDSCATRRRHGPMAHQRRAIRVLVHVAGVAAPRRASGELASTPRRAANADAVFAFDALDLVPTDESALDAWLAATAALLKPRGRLAGMSVLTRRNCGRAHKRRSLPRPVLARRGRWHWCVQQRSLRSLVSRSVSTRSRDSVRAMSSRCTRVLRFVPTHCPPPSSIARSSILAR
jgi:hypothetical protein